MFHGVFAYINRSPNLNLSQFLTVTTNTKFDWQYGTVADIFPPQSYKHIVIANRGYCQFSLNKMTINITSYSIKSSQSAERALTNYTLEGSLDGMTWFPLHTVEKCDECRTNNARNHKLKNGVYSMFRLNKTDINIDNTQYLDIYGFEIFGTICTPIGCDIIKEPFITINNSHRFHHVLFLLFMII